MGNLYARSAFNHIYPIELPHIPATVASRYLNQAFAAQDIAYTSSLLEKLLFWYSPPGA
jgi:hypothetical protein